MREPRKVALLIETSSAYGRGLLRGIVQYARLRGPWSFLIEPGLPGAPNLGLKEWGAMGMIVALNHLRRRAEPLPAVRVPTVDLDSMPPARFPRGVCNDEPQVGRLAAEHLLGCGLRHFAFCGWFPADDTSAFWETARREGFVRTVRRAGFRVQGYEWPGRRGDWAWAREQRHLAGWLEGLPRPVGLMASNDQRARHVLEAARLAHLQVPQDLAVIGVDNDEVLCEMGTPPLSSVELNTRRVGYEAAAMLDRLMQGRSAGGRSVVVAPLGVAARQSTDVLAMEDRDVAAAVRFIRANAHRPIRVTDVLRAGVVSRRTLEIRFRRALGCTPHEEIRRVRLRRVMDLLVQTDWPLKKVAVAAGFTYAEHLHAVFRRETGMTPADYRALHRGR